MKKLILSVLFAAFVVGGAALAPMPSVAADVWKATLTSSDAGTTNTAAMASQVSMSIQCRTPACYKTGTSSSLTADCSKDYNLGATQAYTTAVATTGTLTHQEADATGALTTAGTGTGSSVSSVYQRDFDSASDTYVAARALDGGNPDCSVFQRYSNRK